MLFLQLLVCEVCYSCSLRSVKYVVPPGFWFVKCVIPPGFWSVKCQCYSSGFWSVKYVVPPGFLSVKNVILTVIGL